MTTIAPKPDWAPAVWRDTRGNMYAQFKGEVLRFEYTDGGLQKLLRLIPAIEGQVGYVSGGQNIADRALDLSGKITKRPVTMTKATERKRMLRDLGPERRARLQELIKKAGIKESK